MVAGPATLLADLQKKSSLVVVVPVTLPVDFQTRASLAVEVVPSVGTLPSGSALSPSADSMLVVLGTFGSVAPQTTSFENLIGLRTPDYPLATQVIGFALALDTVPALDAALCHLSYQLFLHLSSLATVLPPLLLPLMLPIAGR